MAILVVKKVFPLVNRRLAVGDEITETELLSTLSGDQLADFKTRHFLVAKDTKMAERVIQNADESRVELPKEEAESEIVADAQDRAEASRPPPRRR